MRTAHEDEGVWLTFYGDDFTGSTDVMEVLTLSGVPTVLFTGPPTAADLDRFAGVAAVGVAGMARTLSPTEAQRQVRPVLESLAALGAPIFHYKICSTFDSSIEIGNIGHAIRMTRDVFSSEQTPLIVAAPVLGRYCVFGDLFANFRGAIYRLDRHPTMRHHPVTPMRESHIPTLLSEQADLTTAVIDIVRLRQQQIATDVTAEEPRADVMLFDAIDDDDMAIVGRLLQSLVDSNRAQSVVTTVFGSSGVEYALAAHARHVGNALRPRYTSPVSEPTGALVISGSRSPATQRQIERAITAGMIPVTLDPLFPHDTDEVRDNAARLLSAGHSVVVFVPEEPDNTVTSDADALGRSLGSIARQLAVEQDVRRMVVAGGDTSGWVVQALEISALEMIAPIAPGSPLCRAHSSIAEIDGLEIALKGGQVGDDDYLVTAARLGAAHEKDQPTRRTA